MASWFHSEKGQSKTCHIIIFLKELILLSIKHSPNQYKILLRLICFFFAKF